MASPESTLAKVSSNQKLTGFRSDYVFIGYAGPGTLTTYDQIDFGLFGRTWCPIVSWAIGFVPSANESSWRDYLPAARSNIMGGAAFHVVASDASHGILLATDSEGSYQRALHAVRAVVPLDKLKVDSSIVASGGSLVLQLNLLDDPNKTGDVVDSDFTFDGQVYWSLYLN